MTFLKRLNELLPILYPEFYVVTDTENNELVFLKTGENNVTDGLRVTDKTQCEAFVNHFHLFERIADNDYSLLEKIGKKIAHNLLESLKQNFPQKKFIVYFELNITDSSIIRFHQVWENELPYFDMSATYKNTTLFEFTN